MSDAISPLATPFPALPAIAGVKLRVARAGWLLHDRVLRPAAVFVSAGPAQ